MYEELLIPSIICVSCVLFLVCFYLILRSYLDRRRSNDIDERDTRIKEGFTDSKRTSGNIAESINGAGSHLDRAESILQRAIDRRDKKEEKLSDSNNSNK